MTGNNADFTREQLLIESIKDWVGDRFIGDDCALLPGRQLVSSDTLVEGTHFILGKISWEDLGWKAVAVNLSDIAAMAGRPRHLIVNLTLPDTVTRGNLRSLYKGMVDCAKSYRCEIVGGDLTSGPTLVVTVTVLGDEHEGGVLKRSGARAGDVIVSTGDFGASAAGLWLLLNESDKGIAPHCLHEHVHPLPRLCESWSLLRQTRGRGALMDTSDGLADAVVQIARASQVGAILNFETLPIHPQTAQVAKLANVDPVNWALYGGEDYELVGTLSEDAWFNWTDDNPFRLIGSIVAGSGVTVKSFDYYGLDADKSLSVTKESRSIDLSQCFKQIKL